MLNKVSGCPSSSIRLLASNTLTSSPSAFTRRYWQLYIDARSSM
ncbi:Protein of unknown function [Pyronema omphalodes CBS 100304]|uniref:Uncharacterized protein n=1 Tax=Pyronema omphalodes (strain CBS 100304) TaxID=1076935 RepID=U4LD39_PYROM|nr:Protein of unknown function [Pyronema omphalodes CBS 100304]